MTNRMQVTSAYSSVDSVFAEALFEELPAPHHPMLPASKSRNRASIPARPHQPVLKAG